jgi:hypothetical protein
MWWLKKASGQEVYLKLGGIKKPIDTLAFENCVIN